MTLYHYIGSTWDLGGRTGISRFDGYLKQVFPEMVTVGAVPAGLDASQGVVVTDNHLSLRGPVGVPTVVVHHGCSRTLYERETRMLDEEALARGGKPECAVFPSFRVHAQDFMFTLPNRTYVAPSLWVKNEFVRHYNLPGDYAIVIPHWVPLIDRDPHKQVGSRPVVIGDWRDEQKGKYLVKSLAEFCPEVDFRPLRFSTEEEKLAQYREADYFLCLSLSEGFCYAMADAEAASLSIISTLVGGFPRAARFVIPWDVRRDIHLLAGTINGITLNGFSRCFSSFYAIYTFSEWSRRWHEVVEKAKQGAPALK